MNQTGLLYWNRMQYGVQTHTFEVICGRIPTLAEASLNVVTNDGYRSCGIREYWTRNTPVSEEQKVDFSPYYWNWPGRVYNHTMTRMTFAVGTGPSTNLSCHMQLTFYAF